MLICGGEGGTKGQLNIKTGDLGKTAAGKPGLSSAAQRCSRLMEFQANKYAKNAAMIFVLFLFGYSLVGNTL